MDYKEKYQKALERAKKGLPIDEVFPELKESEDEGIRRFIIDCISELQKANTENAKFNVRCGEAISYIEKQKEQNLTECTSDSVLQKIKRAITDCRELSEHYKDTKENFYQYYGGKADGLQLALAYFGNKNELAEQKLAEKITDAEIEQAMDEVTKFKVFAADLAKAFSITHRRDIDWHNFCAGLLTYLELNRPAKWSEEDEEMLGAMVDIVANSLYEPLCPRDKMLCWLKSLRPQPHWKPSDEQMMALQTAVADSLGRDYHNQLSLLEFDLRKRM